MGTPAERTWAALLRAHAALLPRMERAVLAETGTSLVWYDVLLELQGAGGRLTMGQLGERVVLSRSRVSRIVDELAAAGLVERETNPRDARSTFATLTTAGRRRFLLVARAYQPVIERELGALGEEKLDRIADDLESIQELSTPDDSDSGAEER
jgi:DNA-binding MarR family transcriptional regulator